MKLSSYIFGLLIVGVCVLTVYGLVESLTAERNYDMNVDTRYREMYDKVGEIGDDINKTTYELQATPEDKEAQYWTGIVDFLKTSKNVIFGGVGAITGSVNVGYEFIVITTQEVGLPSYTIKVLFAFLAITIFAIVFYMYTGRQV